jgi:hypothetical protein
MAKKQIYIVLDNEIADEAIVLAMIEAYLAERRKRVKETSDNEWKWYPNKCPICGDDYGGTTPANAARALSAHMRQICKRG